MMYDSQYDQLVLIQTTGASVLYLPSCSSMVGSGLAIIVGYIYIENENAYIAYENVYRKHVGT